MCKIGFVRRESLVVDKVIDETNAGYNLGYIDAGNKFTKRLDKAFCIIRSGYKKKYIFAVET